MLLVREDTFDWKLGQFRVLYVEHPRKTGFKWIDLGYKKPRPAVRTEEALFCSICKRYSTTSAVFMAKGAYLGRTDCPKATLFGLACMECKMKAVEAWEARRAAPKTATAPEVVVLDETPAPPKAEPQPELEVTIAVRTTTEAVIQIRGRPGIPPADSGYDAPAPVVIKPALVTHESLKSAIDDWLAKGGTIQRINPKVTMER